MDYGQISVVIAALAMLGLHFFRGPNRQYDDLIERIKIAEQQIAGLRADYNALAVRLAGEHYTRSEIKELLRDMKEAVERVQGTVDRVLELQRTRNG